MLGNSALAQLALAEFPQAITVAVVVDTHDGGFVKRKKRKPRLFDNELDQLKYQIEEVVETPEVEIVAKEPIPETYPLPKVYPSLLAPNVDYVNLAKADLLARIKEDPSLRWTPEEREEEEELMLILDSLQ